MERFVHERFIHDQNLTRYIGLLEAETDGGQRARLQTLLIEEENRYGANRERLEQADLLVRKSHARVRQQELLLARLTSDGRDISLAERVMENMVDLLFLLEDYRQTVSAEVERSHPSHLA